MITLNLITAADITEINTWPSYVNDFEQMDYAVRQGGWLDEFASRPNTRIYAAWLDGRISGFSLLAGSDEGSAEFRIAVHPGQTGKGIGRAIALATLETGFRDLRLDHIDLIVRKNNFPAMNLYKSLGFQQRGESIHTIRGQSIEFFDMDITPLELNRMTNKEAL